MITDVIRLAACVSPGGVAVSNFRSVIAMSNDVDEDNREKVTKKKVSSMRQVCTRRDCLEPAARKGEHGDVESRPRATSTDRYFARTKRTVNRGLARRYAGHIDIDYVLIWIHFSYVNRDTKLTPDA